MEKSKLYGFVGIGLAAIVTSVTQDLKAWDKSKPFDWKIALKKWLVAGVIAIVSASGVVAASNV